MSLQLTTVKGENVFGTLSQKTKSFVSKGGLRRGRKEGGFRRVGSVCERDRIGSFARVEEEKVAQKKRMKEEDKIKTKKRIKRMIDSFLK